MSLHQLVRPLVAGREHDERLHDVAAPLVGRRHRRGLGDRRVLEARGLDLERPDPVPGGDDHVVGAALVPDVAVLVEARRVLGVEPLAVERLLAGLVVAPVAERIVRVRARAQADLAALALRHRPLVLVEDRDVPARHRLAHRALADLHERVVGDQRVGLGEAVVVEHGEAVLLAEPADRLGVQRLAGRAHAPELLRVARAGVGDRHHRAHRRRRREHVRDGVAGEHVELLVRVEAALALVDHLHRAEPPRPEQRRDPGRPRPLAHAVEQLALLHLVAVHELLVREHVAVGVQDALRQARGAGGVVQLRGVVGGGVDDVERRVAGRQQVGVEDQHLVGVHAAGVGGVGDQHLRLGVVDPVADPVVAVQHRHREQDRPRLPRAEERGRRLRRRREQHRDAVAALDPVRAQDVGEAVRPLLQLAPGHLADVALVVLVDHRELVRRMLVAAVDGDVVALRDAPLVCGDRFLV